MDIPDTRVILGIIATYDHRVVTDQAVTDWQRALTRIPIEAAFDAIDQHYDRCTNAAAIPLTPPEILRHVQAARDQQAIEDRRQRDREANERLFGSLEDHRTPAQREASLTAMRAARAHVNAVLDQRRTAAAPAEEPA